MTINVPEAYPVDQFSQEAVRAQIAEAQKVANGSGSAQDIEEAKIELEVCHIFKGLTGFERISLLTRLLSFSGA